jgi:hypothetical protein
MTHLGPALIAFFVLSQALRDVYLAQVFRSVDVFALILATFPLMAAIFGGLALWRDRAGFSKLRTHMGLVIAMNVTKALAWTSYFFGLKFVQPSVLNALHSGFGPLTVLALATMGASLGGKDRGNRIEKACYAGLASSMLFLAWLVLSGGSGRLDTSFASAIIGLAALTASGISITLSHLLAKRLNDHGVGANAVTGARYLLISFIAFGVVITGERITGVANASGWLWLAARATPLIALPLYALQVGISMTKPLTAQVLRALGPVVIFALELTDERVVWSGATLAGLVAYSVFATAAGLAHGAKNRGPSPER